MQWVVVLRRAGLVILLVVFLFACTDRSQQFEKERINFSNDSKIVECFHVKDATEDLVSSVYSIGDGQLSSEDYLLVISKSVAHLEEADLKTTECVNLISLGEEYVSLLPFRDNILNLNQRVVAIKSVLSTYKRKMEAKPSEKDYLIEMMVKMIDIQR